VNISYFADFSGLAISFHMDTQRQACPLATFSVLIAADSDSRKAAIAQHQVTVKVL
jgi:hypothetical protein